MKKFYGLSVKGVAAFDGGRHVRFTYDSQTPTYLPLEMCVSEPPKRIVEALSTRGFQSLGKPAADRIGDNLSDVDVFTNDNIIDRVGWVAPYFALPSGRVLGPQDAVQMKAVFQPSRTLSRRSGALREWKRRIAGPITGQPLAVFAAGLPLAAVLAKFVNLRQSLAFEVVDPAGNGSSVLYAIAGSVTGDVLAGPIPFSIARRNAATERFLHADGLMMVQDARADLASLSPARIRSEVLGLLRDGMSSTHGHGGKGGVAILTVAKASFVDLVGADTPAAQAVAEHTITLEVPSDQSFGVFEDLPEAFDTSSAAISAITAAAREHHGIALEMFIAGCVQKAANDLAAFSGHIGRAMASFRRHAAVDLNNMSEVSIADSFGLVYASLKIARDLRILPVRWHGYGRAILSCYQNYRVTHRSVEPGAELIDQLAARDDVLVLTARHDHSSETVRQARLFFRKWSGSRVLMIRPDDLSEFVPVKDRFLDRSDVRARLMRDGQHLTKHCRLHPLEKQERMHCFQLSSAAAKS